MDNHESSGAVGVKPKEEGLPSVDADVLRRREFVSTAVAGSLSLLLGCSPSSYNGYDTKKRAKFLLPVINGRIPGGGNVEAESIKIVEVTESDPVTLVFAGVSYGNSSSGCTAQCVEGYAYVIDGQIIIKHMRLGNPVRQDGRKSDDAGLHEQVDKTMSDFVEQNKSPHEFFGVPGPPPDQNRPVQRQGGEQEEKEREPTLREIEDARGDAARQEAAKEREERQKQEEEREKTEFEKRVEQEEGDFWDE